GARIDEDELRGAARSEHHIMPAGSGIEDCDFGGFAAADVIEQTAGDGDTHAIDVTAEISATDDGQHGFAIFRMNSDHPAYAACLSHDAKRARYEYSTPEFPESTIRDSIRESNRNKLQPTARSDRSGSTRRFDEQARARPDRECKSERRGRRY